MSASVDVDVNAILIRVRETLGGLRALETSYARRKESTSELLSSSDLMDASLCLVRSRELEEALTSFCEAALALQSVEQRVRHTLDRLRRKLDGA